MKKLLAMLGAAGLVVSTSAVLVSCGPTEPDKTALEKVIESIQKDVDKAISDGFASIDEANDFVTSLLNYSTLGEKGWEKDTVLVKIVEESSRQQFSKSVEIWGSQEKDGVFVQSETSKIIKIEATIITEEEKAQAQLIAELGKINDLDITSFDHEPTDKEITDAAIDKIGVSENFSVTAKIAGTRANGEKQVEFILTHKTITSVTGNKTVKVTYEFVSEEELAKVELDSELTKINNMKLDNFDHEPEDKEITDAAIDKIGVSKNFSVTAKIVGTRANGEKQVEFTLTHKTITSVTGNKTVKVTYVYKSENESEEEAAQSELIAELEAINNFSVTPFDHEPTDKEITDAAIDKIGVSENFSVTAKIVGTRANGEKQVEFTLTHKTITSVTGNKIVKVTYEFVSEEELAKVELDSELTKINNMKLDNFDHEPTDKEITDAAIAKIGVSENFSVTAKIAGTRANGEKQVEFTLTHKTITSVTGNKTVKVTYEFVSEEETAAKEALNIELGKINDLDITSFDHEPTDKEITDAAIAKIGVSENFSVTAKIAGTRANGEKQVEFTLTHKTITSVTGNKTVKVTYEFVSEEEAAEAAAKEALNIELGKINDLDITSFDHEPTDKEITDAAIAKIGVSENFSVTAKIVGTRANGEKQVEFTLTHKTITSVTGNKTVKVTYEFVSEEEAAEAAAKEALNIELGKINDLDITSFDHEPTDKEITDAAIAKIWVSENFSVTAKIVGTRANGEKQVEFTLTHKTITSVTGNKTVKVTYEFVSEEEAAAKEALNIELGKINDLDITSFDHEPTDKEITDAAIAKIGVSENFSVTAKIVGTRANGEKQVEFTLTHKTITSVTGNKTVKVTYEFEEENGSGNVEEKFVLFYHS